MAYKRSTRSQTKKEDQKKKSTNTENMNDYQDEDIVNDAEYEFMQKHGAEDYFLPPEGETREGEAKRREETSMRTGKKKKEEEEDEAELETVEEGEGMATGPILKERLRESSIEKHYEPEDESLMEDEEPKYGQVEDVRSKDRQLSSLVAASRRKGRDPAAKRKSAEKASKLNEELTGEPLEINEKGEIV